MTVDPVVLDSCRQHAATVARCITEAMAGPVEMQAWWLGEARAAQVRLGGLLAALDAT